MPKTKMQRFEAVVNRLPEDDRERLLEVCLQLGQVVLREYRAWRRGGRDKAGDAPLRASQGERLTLQSPQPQQVVVKPRLPHQA